MKFQQKIYWIILLIICISISIIIIVTPSNIAESFTNCGNSALPGTLNLENTYYILNIYNNNSLIYDSFVPGQITTDVNSHATVNAINMIYSTISANNVQYENNPLYRFPSIVSDTKTKLSQLTDLYNAIICNYSNLPFSFPTATNVYGFKISGGTGKLQLSQILVFDSNGKYINLTNYNIDSTPADTTYSPNTSPITNSTVYQQYYNPPSFTPNNWTPIQLVNSMGDGVWDMTDNSIFTNSITEYMSTNKYVTIHSTQPNPIPNITDDFILQTATNKYPDYITYCGNQKLNMSMIQHEGFRSRHGNMMSYAAQHAADEQHAAAIQYAATLAAEKLANCNRVTSNIKTDTELSSLVSQEKSYQPIIPYIYRQTEPNANNTVYISLDANAHWTIMLNSPIQIGSIVIFTCSNNNVSDIQGYVIQALDQEKRVLGTSPPLLNSPIQAIQTTSFNKQVNYGPNVSSIS